MDNSYLKPFKNKVRTFNIVAFDTEDDSQGNVTIVNFYDGKSHFTFDLEAGKTLEDVVKFFYVYNPRNSLFVAHNLEYDINNIMRDLDYRFIKKMVYTARLMTVELDNCKQLLIDSTNFFAGSLKKMAKVVGMEKGDYLEARNDKKKNIEYCKSDCEILWTFVTKFQEKMNSEFGVTMAPTIGKMAMDCFKANYLHREYFRYNTPLCRSAYYGGRTEVFYKGALQGNIVCNDVNSMYPYVMLNEFPDTDTMQEGLSYKKAQFGLGTFTVDVPPCTVPPLPYRADSGRLYFPTGEFTGCWTYAEIRNALEHGVKILWEGPCAGTNIGCKPFTGYITDIYSKRLDAKKLQDEFLITFLKLLMNNLYGKFSQNSPKYEMVREEVDPKTLEKQGGALVRHLGPFYMYKYTPLEPPINANWIWGTYITSYARIELFKAMNRVLECGHTLCYTDTDCVIYRMENDKKPFKIGLELGAMDEEIFIEADFKNPKGYILTKGSGELKIACKGVPTAFQADFFKEGYAEFRKPTKLRESLIQNLKANVWNEVSKEMRSIYIKREGVGSNKPINANQILEAENRLKKHLQAQRKKATI